jgi:hypothetical protein
MRLICLLTSSYNPAWHKSRTMVRNYFSRSCYNAFGNLQLQSCLPGGNIIDTFRRGAVPMRFRLQTRIAGATRQIDQHSRTVNSADFFGLLRTIFMWNRALACSRYSLVRILPTSSSKSVPNVTFFLHFEMLIEPSLQSGRRLSRLSPETAETQTLLRRSQEPLYPKTQGFAPEWIHMNSHASELFNQCMHGQITQQF